MSDKTNDIITDRECSGQIMVNGLSAVILTKPL